MIAASDKSDCGPAPAPSSESYSSLSTYAACPRRYAYRYIEHVPGRDRRRVFAFGSALHRALEVYVRTAIAVDGGGERPSGATLWSAFDDSVASAGLTPEEVAALRRDAASAFERFLAHEQHDDATPVAVEVGFGCPVVVDGEAVRLVGYVDRINRRPDGSIEIVDYKTGHLPCQCDADANCQLSTYAYASAHEALRDPATVQPLPRASRLALYNPAEDAIIWTTRDDVALREFEDWLGTLVRRIRDSDFDARPTRSACRWCEYNEVCPSRAG